MEKSQYLLIDLKMIKDFSIYFSGRFLTYLAPLILLPVLTNILTVGDYGVIATFLAFHRVLDIFVSFSGTGAVGRAFIDRSDDGFNFQIYLFNAGLTNLLLFSLILVPFYLIYSMNLIDLPFSVVLLLPFVVIFSTLKAYKHKLWNLQEEALKYSLFLAFFAITSLLISLLLVFSVLPDWRGRIYALVFTELIFCSLSLYWLFKEDGVLFKWNKSYVQDVFKYGLPLVPHAIGLTLLGVTDKLMLNSISGISDVGIFAVSGAIASLIMLVALPLDNIYNPIIFKFLKNPSKNGRDRYVLGFFLYFLILVVAGSVLYFITPWIVNTFIGSQFHAARNYVGILIVGQLAHAMYRYVVVAIFYSKKTKYVSISTLSSGLIGIVSQYFLIKLYGITGAAIGTSLVYCLSFIIAWYFSNNLYPMPWHRLPKNIFKIRFLFKL
jgi:O-antigen/teichoic acid export membrane protein